MKVRAPQTGVARHMCHAQWQGDVFLLNYQRKYKKIMAQSHNKYTAMKPFEIAHDFEVSG